MVAQRLNTNDVRTVIGVDGQFLRGPASEPHPRVFGMLPTTLLADDATVTLPQDAAEARHSASPVIVVGRDIPRHVAPEDVTRYLGGLTIGTLIWDVRWTHEWDGSRGPSYLIGHATDTWAPVATTVAPEVDLRDRRMVSRLNGRVVSEVRMSEMRNSVEHVVAYLSRYLSLRAGDLLFMGAPEPDPSWPPLRRGDVIESELEGVGELRNSVRRAHRTDSEPTTMPRARVGGSRYVRYTVEGASRYGLLGDGEIDELAGDIFGEHHLTGVSTPLAEVRLEVPIGPDVVRKVVGVASNYRQPGQPARRVEHPRWFAKLASALSTDGDLVALPPDAENLNYEGELVVIIGKRGRNIPLEDAASYIFGVTIGNDWSENTWHAQIRGSDAPARLVAKSVDSRATLFPVVFRDVDWRDLGIAIRLNGTVVARGRTSDMINGPERLIHHLSQYVTLEPGDVLFTGTVAPPALPGHRRAVTDGDVVEVEIESLGTLRNQVRAG